MRGIITQLKARIKYAESKKRDIKPVGYRLAHKPVKRDINSFFSSLSPFGAV